MRYDRSRPMARELKGDPANLPFSGFGSQEWQKTGARTLLASRRQSAPQVPRQAGAVSAAATGRVEPAPPRLQPAAASARLPARTPIARARRFLTLLFLLEIDAFVQVAGRRRTVAANDRRLRCRAVACADLFAALASSRGGRCRRQARGARGHGSRKRPPHPTLSPHGAGGRP